MNKKIPALVIAGIVFIFASYNLYSYFDSKAKEEAEQQRQAEIQQAEAKRITLQAERQRQEKQRLADERRKQKAEQEEKKRKLKAERLAKAEAEREAKRLAREQERAEKDAKLEAKQLKKARSLRHIEGLSDSIIEKLLSFSPRFLKDNPQDAKRTYRKRDLGNIKLKKLIADDTNLLMLYSAISEDTEYLQALLDIGIDVNATNKMGVSAFHFASAYNSPEVIKFLAEKGADTQAISYLRDTNALHLASLLNPNPEAIKTLVELGLPLEKPVKNGTAIVLATENQNLEVVEMLVNLGADTSVYDKSGQTLSYLVKQGNYIPTTSNRNNWEEYKNKLIALLK